MIVQRRDQHIEDAAGSAGLRIGGGVDNATNARMHESHGAHRARLQRGIQRRTRETIVADLATRITQGQDFSVRAGIIQRDVAVPAFADDLLANNQNRAHRHFDVSGLPLMS